MGTSKGEMESVTASIGIKIKLSLRLRQTTFIVGIREMADDGDDFN